MYLYYRWQFNELYAACGVAVPDDVVAGPCWAVCPAIITAVLAGRVKKLIVGDHLTVIIPLLSCGASVDKTRVYGNINADLLTLLS